MDYIGVDEFRLIRLTNSQVKHTVTFSLATKAFYCLMFLVRRTVLGQSGLELDTTFQRAW